MKYCCFFHFLEISRPLGESRLRLLLGRSKFAARFLSRFFNVAQWLPTDFYIDGVFCTKCGCRMTLFCWKMSRNLHEAKSALFHINFWPTMLFYGSSFLSEASEKKCWYKIFFSNISRCGVWTSELCHRFFFHGFILCNQERINLKIWSFNL